MKIALGEFAREGLEGSLSSDLVTGVRIALSDFAQRVGDGLRPPSIPAGALEACAEPAVAIELPLDERAWEALEREAARQNATVGQLAAHSVLVYLAELDRLASAPQAG